MTRFELDLLSFHGKSVELDFRVDNSELDWLFEDADEFVAVPGETFAVELTAELIDTTIRLVGMMRGQFRFSCGRCLQERPIVLDSDVQFVLMSRRAWQRSYEDAEEVALSAEDLDVSYYEGEIIDLRPLLREAVLLELPSFPQCGPEESDACDEAFRRHVGEATLEENEENELDLRWSALRDIKLPGSNKAKSN